MPIHYDKKLTSKIKSSLKNYEVEDYDHTHWLDLKNRLDAQKKPFYVQYSWLLGFVGFIFVFTLLGLGLYQKTNSQSNSEIISSLEKEDVIVLQKNNETKNSVNSPKLASKTDLLEQKTNIQGDKIVNSAKNISPNNNIAQIPIVKNSLFASNKKATLLAFDNEIKNVLLNSELDSKLHTEFAILNEAYIALISKKDSLELRQFDIFPLDSLLVNQRRFEVGFSLSPLLYSNRDERVPTKSFTLEGGLHSEWGLGKNRNLKLGTALLLSRNSLAHKEKTSAARTVPDPTDTKNADYTANFLILNVPLYLRYDFGQGKKTNFFVSGGLSNYTYVRESYNYTLKYLEEVFDPQDPTVIIGHKPATFQQKEVKVFSQWNFMSTIDLSMGIRTPLGQKNTLLISPYLRLPVRDLASENVRFSTLGLHLQLNLTN